jgi:hypothetical protein
MSYSSKYYYIIVTNHLFLCLDLFFPGSFFFVSLGVIYVVLRKSQIMTYDLKNVFYLGFQHEYANGAWTAKDSVQPIDVSAYVDPISKGRTRGQGLAVYRVQHQLSTDSGTPVKPAETAEMGMALSVKPYTSTGDLLSGVVEYGDLSNASDLLIQADQFVGATTSASVANSGNGSLLIETLSPSEKVPYVVVRDTIFSIMSSTTAMVADILTSYRMECAMISLDTATLNQLLRTQTA